MWISKTEYEKMKKEINDLQSKLLLSHADTSGLRRENLSLKFQLDKLKETQKIYDLELVLKSGKVISYNISAPDLQKACSIAIDKFCKENKNFYRSDIDSITYKGKVE